MAAFCARAAEHRPAPPPKAKPKAVPAAKVPEVKAKPAPAAPAPKPKPAAPAAKPSPAPPAPTPELGRDVALPGLTDTDCGDIYEMVAQSAMVRLNYVKSDKDLSDRTAGMTRHAVFVRKDADGSTRLLLIGLTCYASQAPRLYLWGTLTTADGLVNPDPDLDALVGKAEDALKAAKAAPRKYSVRDLLYQTYQLSNIDVKSCIDMLKSLGYDTSSPRNIMDLSQLPDIFPIPFTEGESMVGKAMNLQQNRATPLKEPTLSGPENRLMILYHPSQSQQVADLENLLTKTIDVPADQVLIEGLVVELNENDLKQLGVNWQTFGKDWQLSFLNGSQYVPFVASHNPVYKAPAGLENQVQATLTAIINEGKAQVLSSPSVLVLNNRNAQIQITQDVPVFNTIFTYNTTSFNVKFETVGITLNIRPRISQDGENVSMQIVAQVSEAPPQDYVTVNGQNVAPVINRRIVETVARVRDNTPFIIGGLIRNERDTTRDRLPILSDIPILGRLFERTSDTTTRREDIIVLTPRVIKKGSSNRALLPKDSSQFDFLNNQLFRNSYRLKAEDIFDLGFLENNPTVLATMDQARALVGRHPELADEEPYKDLINGVIPGEDAVVIRMIFEICRNRLQLYNAIPDDHIILFVKNPTSPAGFKVEFLERKGKGILEKASPDGTLEGYFNRPYPKKVLFLHYKTDSKLGLEDALQSPAATLEWLNCKNRQEVDQHRLDAEVLGPDHHYHDYVIALADPSDLVRLKSCMAERELTSVNNVQDLLTLRNFRIGRKIVVPELGGEKSRMYLIDRTAAEYFFKSDYYYYALRQQMEQAYKTINDAVSQEPGL